MPSFIHNPEHWRERAKQARNLADLMSDPQSKQKMLTIAKDYDRLADRAAERNRPSQSSSDS